MNKFAILVLGPAGTGKTTFCNTMLERLAADKKKALYVNLDPAAVEFGVVPSVDIRTKYDLEKVMQKERLGPNGALLRCLNLMMNDDDFFCQCFGGFSSELLFVDCPGQIEVYLCSDAMTSLIDKLQSENYSLCVAFLVDSQCTTSSSKFLSIALTSLSAMLRLELPHVNILTKMDLFTEDEDTVLQNYIYPELPFLTSTGKISELDQRISNILEEYDFLSYIPLDITKDESIATVMSQINLLLQNDDRDTF